MVYPENVKKVREFFIQKKLWFNLTRNIKAESCNDAASKRNRLGHIGIPVSDELKSNFGYVIDSNGNRNYVLLHCRGNQFIDMKKVNSLLSSTFTRLSKNMLKKDFGLDYGIINPMVSISNSNIIQIFDKTLFQDIFPPYTIMTNAGHRNWGIEFRLKEFVRVLDNVLIDDIITEDTKPKYIRHKIGILTGNSPESGIMLWNEINSEIRKTLGREFLGDLSFPEIVIESIPEMGLSMELELREGETKGIVIGGIERLCENGASLICIACNTTQYFEKEIKHVCSRYNSSYISISTVVDNFLKKEKITHFDFIGIRYVTDFKKWSAFRKLAKRYTIELPSKTELNRINQLAIKVKQENVNESGRNKLRNLISQSTKTKTIIIALTEISILLSSQKVKSREGRIFIDTLSLLAKELASRYVKGIYKTLFEKKRE